MKYPLVMALILIASDRLHGNESAKPPNVLFIIADDLNCSLGCYGHGVVKSPNVDRLAAKGVRFDRAYVQYTVCNPSRTSFLTGLRPETTRIFGNDVQFRKNLPDVVTLPQLFKKNGYFTASMGKVFHRGLSPDELRPEMDDVASWHHRFYGLATDTGRRGEGRNMTNGKLPWCRWLATEGTDEDQPDGQTTSEAIRLMEQNKPFFLAIGYYRPHDPFHSPKKYFDQYPLDKLDPPKLPQERTPEVRYALPGGAFKQAFDNFTDQDRREYMRCYYAGICFVDAQIGRLLDALEQNRLADNTIVVFIGDHGFHLGERGWWNKSTLFEQSCRTPMIVFAPAMKGNGKPCRGVVEFVDLYPTLADLCGLTPPNNLEGKGFRGLLDDPTKPGKPAAFTMIKRGMNITGRTVRTDRWRYTEWNNGDEGVELYDHLTDPGEWKNVASEPTFAQTRTELHKQLNER